MGQKIPLSRILVQIYEVQTPSEAEEMVRLGVDHVGSVLLSEEKWRVPALKDTIGAVQGAGAVSSMIPLFHREEAVFTALEYYRPDIVHFCELLDDSDQGLSLQEALVRLQERIRERFAPMRIMRSIPIPPSGAGGLEKMLAAARCFEPVSDFFLTDTQIGKGQHDQQPVTGYVGITGRTCDWVLAKELARQSRIPVILAGGISPDNVVQGIRFVRPAGVDSCTHTNAVDKQGRPLRFSKDPERVRRLVQNVRAMESG